MKQIFNLDSPVMTVTSKIFDCICLSLLWALFSLPVITMGAASAALYCSVSKNIRRDRGKLWKTFFDSFKENFKRSTLLWLTELTITAVLITDAIVFRNMYRNGEPLGGIYWVILVFICIDVTWMIYLTAYSARFNGSIKEVLKFSLVLMALHPIRSLEVFVPALGGMIVALILPGLSIILPSAVLWACSFAVERVFVMHMRKEDLEKL